MFDYVRCEVPLPDGFTGELQTKDLGCDMVTHVIRADGRLVIERIDTTELVPKAERPYPDAPDGSIMALAGSMRNIKSQHVPDFHGWLRFYGSEGWHVKGTWKWHEYRAKFTDGQLVKIEQVTE
jgi:hypothetical protein